MTNNDNLPSIDNDQLDSVSGGEGKSGGTTKPTGGGTGIPWRWLFDTKPFKIPAADPPGHSAQRRREGL